jgi:hypothetical protein
MSRSTAAMFLVGTLRVVVAVVTFGGGGEGRRSSVCDKESAGKQPIPGANGRSLNLYNPCISDERDSRHWALGALYPKPVPLRH